MNEYVILISDQKLLKGIVTKHYPANGCIKATFRHFACEEEEKIIVPERWRYPSDLCAVYMSKRGKTYFVDTSINREDTYHACNKLDTAENHYRYANQ